MLLQKPANNSNIRIQLQIEPENKIQLIIVKPRKKIQQGRHL